MISPEVRHLRAFVTTAEELHFGRAAARLNIVQPALSAQIRGLEDMLGVQLLHRTRRIVSLTEPGRVFLDPARRILRQLDQAVDVARRAGRGEVGRLVIGYSAATAHSGLLSRLVGAFHRTTPDVSIEIRELHPALQREALLAGELDVGFVVADAASTVLDFDSRIVETWQLVLALPAGHKLAAHAVVPLAALRDEAFISYEALGEDLGVEAFQMAAGFRPIVTQYAATPTMLLALVAAGLGISTVPAVLKNGAPPGIAFVPVDRPFPELPIVALFCRNNENAALARFIAELAELAES